MWVIALWNRMFYLWLHILVIQSLWNKAVWLMYSRSAFSMWTDCISFILFYRYYNQINLIFHYWAPSTSNVYISVKVGWIECMHKCTFSDSAYARMYLHFHPSCVPVVGHVRLKHLWECIISLVGSLRVMWFQWEFWYDDFGSYYTVKIGSSNFLMT